MITYIDTLSDNGLTYEDYKEFCEVNGIEPRGNGGSHYLNWLAEENTTIFDDFLENMKYSKFAGHVSVCGRVGRWNGTFSIEPKNFDTFEDAIMACVQDCGEVSITLDKGVLTVKSYHHDGVNVFTIHREHGYFWPKYLF